MARANSDATAKAAVALHFDVQRHRVRLAADVARDDRVNCGAIPPELIDTQLFGHERGAFTGAVGERRGWFKRAKFRNHS